MLVIAVVGATATGKSALGVELALALGGEVVGADALQLYRGMDIGTAKLAPEQRRGVAHHLIDVLDVAEPASLASYQRDAQTCVDDIAARGRTAVVVGGSGLYVRAVLDHLEIPPTDPGIRSRLSDEAREHGAAAMHARLRAVDPLAAERVLATNERRIVRALEVIELTGKPFSASLPQPRYRRPCVQIGLRAPLPELDDQIRRRVRQMWDDGMLAEVSRLASQGLREGPTARRAVGYAQALAQLDGLLDEQQAQERTAQLTRRLVRRQRSWFGRDERVHWLDADDPQLLERAVDVVRRSDAR